EPLESAPEVASPWPARSLTDNPATLYGSWWHTLFQLFPWKGSTEQWQAAFSAMQPESPEGTRSAREWRLLIEGMLRDSLLTQFLKCPAVVVHTEYPFLWRTNEQSCLEGVIDLLLIDPRQRRGLILDWKTNRIDRDDEKSFRQKYRPQIAAYWKAVGEITRFDISAGLYSTFTGALVMFQNAELKAEWSRLLQLPPEQMGTEITPRDI
ncbi:MAG: PD-(D/E)XK nuclease family protein, partial [Chthoniobacterales bacterium]|nr:PD-(D/E)XK nuclease family protein [Chthoniobacterales bacterium]